MSKYTEKQLVEFGNFILSKERENNINFKDNVRYVHDTDLENFKAIKN